jgi:hypothetical protein
MRALLALVLIGCSAQVAVPPGNISAEPVEWYQPAVKVDAGLTQSLRPNNPSVEHGRILTPEQTEALRQQANRIEVK